MLCPVFYLFVVVCFEDTATTDLYLSLHTPSLPVPLPISPPHHRPASELQELLGSTYGVLLFEEQAMKLAITAAGFEPAEADALRRAMATFRNVGTIHHFREKMIRGMVERGYEAAFADRCFKQIEGFGSSGFADSHALPFARLGECSAWIKCNPHAAFHIRATTST